MIGIPFKVMFETLFLPDSIKNSSILKIRLEAIFIIKLLLSTSMTIKAFIT